MVTLNIIFSVVPRRDKPSTTPHIHIAHSTPYWLASCPTTTLNGAIRNLNTFTTKEHRTHETELAKRKFPYVDKMVGKCNQINQTQCNNFWKNDKVTDAQISQTLKFIYAQYMGTHMRNIFGPSHTKTPLAPYVTIMIETHGPTFCHPKPITLDFVLVRVWDFELTHNNLLFDGSMCDSITQL